MSTSHMAAHNSIVVYTTIAVELIRDIAYSYISRQEAEKDIKYLSRRIQKEGLQFLTVALPRLGKVIDLCLAQDKILGPVTGFSRWRGHAGPHFLWWLTDRIFCPDGSIRMDADAVAVRHLRQILFLFYKLELPYDSSRKDAVLASFVAVESEIEKNSIPLDHPIVRKARGLVSAVLSSIDPLDIMPSHGPGVVSTGEKEFGKYEFTRTNSALAEVYPFSDYFCFSPDYAAGPEPETLELAPPAKVVLVPKDSRGPRLISCEPLENQWIQQGLRAALYRQIESHWLTAGHVNFTDQTINRELALRNSAISDESGFVTLDMKDASDRVRLDLVVELFSGTKVLTGLLASRSKRTQLPDGSIVPLNKFAPMGSAVCFPVEAIVFWALAVACLTCNGRSRKDATSSVYVYGDDLIVRKKDYSLLLQYFPIFGLMFNDSKCCTGRFFRESCGCDAFKGIDVTPKRLRTRWSIRRRDPKALVSYVEFCNSMYALGHLRVVQYIMNLVESQYGRLPVCSSRQGFVCWIRECGERPNEWRGWGIPVKWNDSTYRYFVKAYIVMPMIKRSKAPRWTQYFHALVRGGAECSDGHYAPRRSISLKRRWMPVLD